MRKTFLTILITLSFLTCFCQSMFFDNLNNSIWTSSDAISNLNLKSYKEIPLTKLIYSADSIDKDVTIWTFKDSILTIEHSFFQQKRYETVGKNKYVVNDKSVLQITLQDGTSLKYKVGIVSTGNYVILYRIKKSRSKSNAN